MAKKKRASAEGLMKAWLKWLMAEVEERYEIIRRDWGPAAFRAFTNLIWRIFCLSLFILVASLVASGVVGHRGWFDGRIFLPYVGILYLCGLGLILYTGQALNAAGLLLSVDAAVDIFNGITPISTEKLGKVATLELDTPRLKRFATLQLVGRFVFYVLLFELLVILTFSFVPVWAKPALVGHLILAGLLFALLSTPWGQASPFGRLAKPVGLVCLLIMLAFAWKEVERLASTTGTLIPSNWPFWFLGLAVIGVAFLLPKRLKSMAAVTGFLMFIWWMFLSPPSQTGRTAPLQTSAGTTTQAASVPAPAPPQTISFKLWNEHGSPVRLLKNGSPYAIIPITRGWDEKGTPNDTWEVRELESNDLLLAFTGMPPSSVYDVK